MFGLLFGSKSIKMLRLAKKNAVFVLELIDQFQKTGDGWYLDKADSHIKDLNEIVEEHTKIFGHIADFGVKPTEAFEAKSIIALIITVDVAIKGLDQDASFEDNKPKAIDKEKQEAIDEEKRIEKIRKAGIAKLSAEREKKAAQHATEVARVSSAVKEEMKRRNLSISNDKKYIEEIKKLENQNMDFFDIFKRQSDKEVTTEFFLRTKSVEQAMSRADEALKSCLKITNGDFTALMNQFPKLMEEAIMLHKDAMAYNEDYMNRLAKLPTRTIENFPEVVVEAFKQCQLHKLEHEETAETFMEHLEATAES